MMRKTISVLLSGLILFNMSGYFFVFRYEQLSMKSRMQAYIRSSAYSGPTDEIVITGALSGNNLKMLDKDEIRYEGKMYDIISVKTAGSKLVIRCINDTREEQLVARMDKYTDEVSGMDPQGKSGHAKALLSQIIKNALLTRFCPEPPRFSALAKFQPVSQDFASVLILPDFPPPRIS